MFPYIHYAQVGFTDLGIDFTPSYAGICTTSDATVITNVVLNNNKITIYRYGGVELTSDTNFKILIKR